MTEHELLNRIAGQDEVALRQLYGLYYPRLARFVFRLTQDTQIVGEVINDVFFVVWQKAGGFRGDSSPSTWIMGIAYKKVLKANKRQQSLRLVELPEDFAGEPASDPAPDVFSLVHRLSLKHQAVIILTYQFGYSYKEISEIVACPENTVKSRMHHARKALQMLLETDS